MARVPAAEIERLKREVSLERLVAARDVKLELRGKELVGACPFCGGAGQTPVVVPATNTWRCDGGCKTGGHVLDWVRKVEGVSLRLATCAPRRCSSACGSASRTARSPHPGPC